MHVVLTGSPLRAEAVLVEVDFFGKRVLAVSHAQIFAEIPVSFVKLEVAPRHGALLGTLLKLLVLHHVVVLDRSEVQQGLLFDCLGAGLRVLDHACV